ncbi:17847_t:CDS:2, partial [Racocetra persica]
IQLNDIIEIKTFSTHEAIYLLKKAFHALWAFLFLQVLQVTNVFFIGYLGYTSGNPKIAGIYTQLPIIIMMLGFIPIEIIWLVSENIWIDLGQDAELSHYAPPALIFWCLEKFLQGQTSHRLILTIALILYQISHSLAVAASNSVSNLLGAGLPNRATIATNTLLILAIMGATCNAM